MVFFPQAVLIYSEGSALHTGYRSLPNNSCITLAGNKYRLPAEGQTYFIGRYPLGKIPVEDTLGYFEILLLLLLAFPQTPPSIIFVLGHPPIRRGKASTYRLPRNLLCPDQ
jgi:hypothetical protein